MSKCDLINFFRKIFGGIYFATLIFVQGFLLNQYLESQGSGFYHSKWCQPDTSQYLLESVFNDSQLIQVAATQYTLFSLFDVAVLSVELIKFQAQKLKEIYRPYQFLRNRGPPHNF